MTLTINGRAEAVPGDELSVVELLEARNVEAPDMVSVQLNGTVLGRSAFETTRVREGDEVEFLYFMGGGA